MHKCLNDQVKSFIHIALCYNILELIIGTYIGDELMKKVKIILSAMVILMFVLSGCSGTVNKASSGQGAVGEKIPALTDTQIRSMTIDADKALVKAFSSDNADMNDTISNGSQDGMSYGRSLTYKSRDEVRKDLMKYFEKEGIENHLNKNTIEKNNKLYILIGEAGERPDFNKSELKVVKKDNTIQAEFSSKIDAGDIVKETKYMEYKDGKWLFKELWYIN